MSVFVEHLMKEHEEILERLEALERASREGAFEQLPGAIRSLRSLVEEEHHAKEEQLLFPALARAGFEGRSGPRCTGFLQLREDWDYVGAIQREIAVAGEALERPTDSSFLSIPLEEHAAGAALSRLIERYALVRCPRELEPDGVRRLVFEYVTLLRVHIQKENECLFIVANELLSAEAQRALLAQVERGGA